jgi:galactokinase
MDQYACIFGREGRAILLDCRSLKSRLIPFPSPAALVVADTAVRRVLGESGYHKRQEECAAAAKAMARAFKGVKNLRDVSMDMLDAKAAALGDVRYRRARHVVTENARVREAAKAMTAGDVARLGGLMAESHRSLRDDFEVSCAQLDTMVASAEGLDGHYGTRMTGGGFGGCTVSLVEKDGAGEFARVLAERYRNATGLVPATYVIRPGRGAGVLEGGKA